MKYILVLAIAVASLMSAAEAKDIKIVVQVGPQSEGKTYQCNVHESSTAREIISTCDYQGRSKPGYVPISSLLPSNYEQKYEYKLWPSKLLIKTEALNLQGVRDNDLISIEESKKIKIGVQLGSWFKGKTYQCNVHESSTVREIISICDDQGRDQPGYVPMSSLVPSNCDQKCEFKMWPSKHLIKTNSLGSEGVGEGDLIHIKWKE